MLFEELLERLAVGLLRLLCFLLGRLFSAFRRGRLDFSALLSRIIGDDLHLGVSAGVVEVGTLIVLGLASIEDRLEVGGILVRIVGENGRNGRR
jgi:hypothetical protein